MKPKPQEQESESIILICDGDDNLTPEQYAQAFCLEDQEDTKDSDGD
jgi:hypothetical protein